MKIGVRELTNEQMVFGSVFICCILAIVLYIFIYAPLMGRLSKSGRDCRAIEENVVDVRHIINSGAKGGRDRILPSEERVAEAMNELTEKGKEEGVNFIFISPRDIETIPELKYKVQPVNMRLKSGYKQLGTFLGALDEFEKGLLRVRSFAIKPEDDDSGLITDLVVDIYLSNIIDE